jgi:hypothetical protein
MVSARQLANSITRPRRQRGQPANRSRSLGDILQRRVFAVAGQRETS